MNMAVAGTRATWRTSSAKARLPSAIIPPQVACGGGRSELGPCFVEPTVLTDATDSMRVFQEEIFGPVLSTVRAGSYEEALGLAMDHEYGNGTAIFTRDGDTARDFAHRINIGMVGINVPIPVPLAYHTFGGWKKSMFGDLNQHGPDSFRFYSRTKTVTSRWPSGLKEGGEFHFKAMD